MNRESFFDHLRGTLFKGGLKQSQVATIDALLDAAEERGTRRDRLAYILATARHEPGDDMAPKDENLWYRDGDRIRKTWPSRFASAAAAQPYARNPRALANKVYGGRNGNRAADDGWTYRGRGLVQLTGRDNYARAGKHLGIDLEANPERANELAIAVAILVDGMEGGWFTGVSLADAEKVPGWEDDRAIVNGRDRAALIAGYAEAFSGALAAAGYSGLPPQPTTPRPGLPPQQIARLRALVAEITEILAHETV